MGDARRNSLEVGLDKTLANFAPLTPLTFIAWSAYVYPRKPAVVHGRRRFTWGETYARCRRLASALAARGIGVGNTVAVMLTNTPEMYECHFGVPMTGAVLNTLNTRLDAEALAFMIEHAEAKVLITDREFSPTIAKALTEVQSRPLVIDVDDPEHSGPGERIGEIDYEAFLSAGDPDYAWQPPSDEWNTISLNYTSGTTGNPKGVAYHHRGAHLNAIGNVLSWSMPRHSIYLWTLPMFHCNGWCFPWSIAAIAGTNVCLRKVDAAMIFGLIREHRVTHYCGAPIVHNTLINAPAELREGISHKIHALVAAAAPPAATIAAMEPVPWDGTTVGEIMFRGNITMKGYAKNPKATQEAFEGGWFHSGDLAVMQPDGYFKITDRAKDVIISGGENISSLEVEDALYDHPAVLAAAVVAQPDPKWGETPCAFVELKPGAQATPAELIQHCRARLAHFKAPKTVIFGPIPKTSTGKVQKHILRQRTRATAAIE